MVNLMLGKWHPDTAALRRYLVDEDTSTVPTASTGARGHRRGVIGERS
jgi:hypothetical protein